MSNLGLLAPDAHGRLYRVSTTTDHVWFSSYIGITKDGLITSQPAEYFRQDSKQFNSYYGDGEWLTRTLIASYHHSDAVIANLDNLFIEAYTPKSSWNDINLVKTADVLDDL